MSKKKADLIVAGGLILTMDKAGRRFEKGSVIVADGRITAVGPAETAQEYQAAKTLDASNGLILPGLINSHTHAAMTLFRGLADDLPLMTWLEEHIFPAEAKLDAELVATGTRLACAEMIRGGTTCLCDMYLWEDTVARVIDEVGLRAIVGEVLYDFPSPHYGQPASGLDFTRDLMAHYRDHARISVMAMPHALYTCSPDLLAQAFDLARDAGAGVHLHLSENAGEVAQVKKTYGSRPVGHLDGLGLLGSDLLAAHAVMLTGEEVDLLAAKGVRVAHCPESNMKLASGNAPLPELIEAGVRVGLGTDGAASNNDLSLLGEMRSCALIHKAVRLDPTVADAATVLGLATSQAGRALGLSEEIGSLEPGKRADLIVIDLDQPHLTPIYNPISHLVYTALPSDVRHSVVEGRVLMADRELLTIDLAALAAEVREAAARIKS